MKMVRVCSSDGDLQVCAPGTEMEGQIGPFYWIVTDNGGQRDATSLMPEGIDNIVLAMDYAERHNAIAVIELYHEPTDPPMNTPDKAAMVLKAASEV